jgi:hypothetical protein
MDYDEQNQYNQALEDIGNRRLVTIPEEYRNNQDFVRSAVSLEPLVFESASPELRNNQEFILSLIHANPVYPRWNIVRGASDELRGNREFMLRIISRYGNALKNDREVVIAAIRSNVLSLMFASPALRNDPEMLALQQQRNNRGRTMRAIQARGPMPGGRRTRQKRQKRQRKSPRRLR